MSYEFPRPLPSRPLVVALIGLPGAGKSTIARALEAQFGLHRVCRDHIRSAMFPRCDHTPAEKRAAQKALYTALEVNCLLGRSSVIDGMTFSRRSDLEAVDKVIAPYSVQAMPIYLDVPPSLARERVASDQHVHLARDRTPALVDEVMARFETPPPGCTVLDAKLPVQELVQAAIGAVAQRLLGG